MCYIGCPNEKQGGRPDSKGKCDFRNREMPKYCKFYKPKEIKVTANMDIWNALKRPPASALKKISGGRLSGMTDISPQWRYQIMTERFGPVGVGWKYTIDKIWTEQGSDTQVCAFAQVSLYYITTPDVADLWSDPIPGVGGSMLVAKETSKMHTSDEAFKMAITDALGTAMKTLGVAADIYAGLWDGSKYKDTPQSQSKAPAARTVQAPAQTFKGHQGGQDRPPAGVKLSGEHKPATDAQMNAIRKMCKFANMVDEEPQRFIDFVEKSEALTVPSASEVIKNFEQFKDSFYKSQVETDIPI